ncbi:cis-prenyltransferase 4, chloroplastic-like [Spinacia oleracea]|uniref:Alkyl transferase n=1 Tax=Spinacia oleracea TaxID=3562 RepID=A0A9R0IKS5_SPIOL|nr:cis-prenyltransferase 4, chloroplastic-like [Spinacia oleracea]
MKGFNSVIIFRMSVLKKLWLLIMAIIPSWILNTPLFLYLKKKQRQAQKEAFVKMLSSTFRFDDIIEDGDVKLPKGLQPELMPRHVAVILDGSRRWAKKRGFLPVEGYEAGVAALGEFLLLCQRWKIPIVSLFMFSSENWLRPKEEVDFLFELFEGSLRYYLLRTCRRFGGRVSVIGDTFTLPNSLQKAIEEIEEQTKDNNNGIHLVLAISYSGQNDILHACQIIATKVKDGLLQPEDITKAFFQQHLQTNVTDIPLPDLIIRTSGELRISNFFLWQSAYSEMYFTDTLWPDFGECEFVKALRSYQKRARRFGKA